MTGATSATGSRFLDGFGLTAALVGGPAGLTVEAFVPTPAPLGVIFGHGLGADNLGPAPAVGAGQAEGGVDEFGQGYLSAAAVLPMTLYRPSVQRSGSIPTASGLVEMMAWLTYTLDPSASLNVVPTFVPLG